MKVTVSCFALAFVSDFGTVKVIELEFPTEYSSSIASAFVSQIENVKPIGKDWVTRS